VFSQGKAGQNVQLFVAVAPPLWFMEGMAEYLSLGPTNTETAMWLRDAVLENRLPSIEQMTVDPRIFPYRFGHALFSYIGERWGDEAVGALLQGATRAGIEGSIRRTLGLTSEQLSQQWRDAVFREYLPEVGERVSASQIAQVSLDQARTKGTLHIAPALSPDGTLIAFFSERDGFSVDMFLADAATGRVKRRLLKPTWSSNYETFRFLNSKGAFSRDGRLLAVTGRRGKFDDIIILEAERNKTIRRIPIKLDGATTPSWSPDGKQLVFTGYEGGWSDLFIVNADGTGFRRLTNDLYADLHPAWSPDGKHIAFTTDRGPGTDFETLTIGNYRIALLDVESGAFRVLDDMDAGKNIDPVWSPEGESLAFVSDRGGVSDIYLYELAEDQVYRLTDFLTGSAGFTPLSPVLSWASKSDRLAFMYYEKGAYDVYILDNPRKLKREPWVAQAPGDTARRQVEIVSRPPSDTAAQAGVGVGGTIYRGREGFRRADEIPRPAGDSAIPRPEPISIQRLLDSATLALPDTSEFTFRPYRKRYSPDFVARPQIGYVRDNFGNGLFGSTAIALSDVLGNTQMNFAIAINGRIEEGFFQAGYTDVSRRINWAVSATQIPFFFAEPQTVSQEGETTVYRSNSRRLVQRFLSATAWRPFTRFQRVELDMKAGHIDDDLVTVEERFGPNGAEPPEIITTSLGGVPFFLPSVALVFDNTIFGYTGPYLGTRYRLSLGQSIGGWKYTQLLADFRRYIALKGPVNLALRGIYYGRHGPDANQFSVYIGIPELVRGHTSGSYVRGECTAAGAAVCLPLERLVGEQVAVANAELRFPILTPQMKFAPPGFPPIEGTVFYDIGMAWNRGSTLRWNLQPGDNPFVVRTPIMAWGVGARMNLFGLMLLRLDWAFPMDRKPFLNSLVTLSLGPTF
jgi:Tol biopolymer transport system component